MSKRPTKAQQTVQVEDYGDDSLNRLAVVLRGLEQMDVEERSAALRYIKSRHSGEWPGTDY